MIDLLDIATSYGFNPSKDSSLTLSVRAEFPHRVAAALAEHGVKFDYEARRTWQFLQATIWGVKKSKPVPRDQIPPDLLYHVPLVWACRLLFVPLREVSRPQALHALQYEFVRLLDGYGYQPPEQRSMDKPFGKPWSAFPLYQIVCDNDWKEGVGPIWGLGTKGAKLENVHAGAPSALDLEAVR
jgi:hypothetical protein